MTGPAETTTLTTDVLHVELLASVGGRAHRIRAFGRDLLRAPDDPATHAEDPFFHGWYSMVPWTNRVPDGRLDLPPPEGGVVQLPSNYPDGSALHGHAVSAPWSVVEPGVFEFAYPAGGEFPWAYTATQRWAVDGVDGATLTQELSVRNEADTPMPAGLGIHPWWVADGGLEVHVPARAAYHCEDGLAIGPPHPTDDPPRGPVAWGVDHLFTDLAEHAVVLRWPEWDIQATLAFSPTADHLHVAAFERAGAVAVEPVTHAGDGHRRLRDGEPGAIDVIAPGETLSVTYRLTVSRAERSGWRTAR